MLQWLTQVDRISIGQPAALDVKLPSNWTRRMVPPNQPSRGVRFGGFEIDLETAELRTNGNKFTLQDQPFQVLVVLLEHPGRLVTREELKKKLWPADTFVDFDRGLNKAVNRLREVLADSAEHPLFIETLPRRGYRFIGPVTTLAERSIDGETRDAGTTAVTRTGKHHRYHGLAWPAGVALALAAAAVWVIELPPPASPKVLSFRQLTNDGQVKGGPLVTDGSRIYFNETLPGRRSVIVQVSIKGGEVLPFSVPLKQPRLADLSREGTDFLIAGEGFAPSSLWVQSVNGGSPRAVGTVTVDNAFFGADATTILYSRGFDVFSIHGDGSAQRRLLTAVGYPYGLRVSRDGRILRFSEFSESTQSFAVIEANADGSARHELFAGCGGNWTSDGAYFVFQRQREGRTDLWTLSEHRHFSLRKPDNKPIQLTFGPLNFEEPLPGREDKQLFAIGKSLRTEVIRYNSRSGEFVPFLSGISAEGLAFSRDGQWVTYVSYPEGTLWRSKVDGTERLQLTFPPLQVLLPRWSPDGKQIAFNAVSPGAPWNIYLVSSEGGTPERILPSQETQVDASWSPDGRSLVFGSFDLTNAPISMIDLKSRRVTTLPDSEGLFSPRWSPDGRYIVALVAFGPPKPSLFDFGTQKWTEISGDMEYPSWSHDAKYVYFQAWRDYEHAAGEHIVRLRLSDRKLEEVVDVQNIGRVAAGTVTDWFGLAPDDSPLFTRDISVQEIYALDVQWP